MKNRIKSFGYAAKGIKAALKSEINMKIHLVMAVLVVICGIFFRISLNEWLICLLCFGIVMSAEIMNTAIETVVDLVSPDKNKLAGKAKDAAAGAVLVAAIFAAIAGLIFFVPKRVAFLQSFLISSINNCHEKSICRFIRFNLPKSLLHLW